LSIPDFLEIKQKSRTRTPNDNQEIPSARKSKQKIDSASPSPKQITFTEPEPFPSSRTPVRTLPSPLLPQNTSPPPFGSRETPSKPVSLPSLVKTQPTRAIPVLVDARTGLAEVKTLPSKVKPSTPVLRSPEIAEVKALDSPAPKSRLPEKSAPSLLNRLTLDINTDDDDWFPGYSFASAGAVTDPTPDVKASTNQGIQEAIRPVIAQEVILPANHDPIISRDRPLQNQKWEEAIPILSADDQPRKPLQMQIQETSAKPNESNEDIRRNSQIQPPERALSPGQDLLKFAKQLRKHSVQSNDSDNEPYSTARLSDPPFDDSQPQHSGQILTQQQGLDERGSSWQDGQYPSAQQSSVPNFPSYGPTSQMPGQFPLSPQSPAELERRIERPVPNTGNYAVAESHILYPQAFAPPPPEQAQQYQLFPSPRQAASQPATQAPARPEQQYYPPPPVRESYIPPPPPQDYFSIAPRPDVRLPEPPAIPLASKPRFLGPSIPSAPSTPGTEIVHMATPSMYTIPEGYGHSHDHSLQRSIEPQHDIYDRTTSPVYRLPSRSSLRQTGPPSSTYGSPYEIWTQVPSPPIEVTHHHVHYDYNNTGFTREAFQRVASPPTSVISRPPSRVSNFRPPTGRLEDRKMLTQAPYVSEILDNDPRESMTPSRAAPRPDVALRKQASNRSQMYEPPMHAPEAKRVSRKTSRGFSGLFGSKKGKNGIATNY
jgi:hypothetical protein